MICFAYACSAGKYPILGEVAMSAAVSFVATGAFLVELCTLVKFLIKFGFLGKITGKHEPASQK
jgi:hypothetical protein